MSKPRPHDPAEILARAEARLKRLDGLRDALLAQVAALRANLSDARASVGRGGTETTAEARSPTATGVPRTAAEKIALFRALFRGRTDVFPTRWVNRRTGPRATPPPAPTSGSAAYARSLA